MKQTKYFESQAAFEVYYPDGKVPSKELAVIGDYDALATSTNDFGGVYTQAEMLTPSGSISITANGSNIDVAQYEKANVNVPIPEGYIIPSGSISITENGEDIDVTQYAGANVNVPIPEGYIIPSGSITITENGENIDIRQYAYITINVSGGDTPTPSVDYSTQYLTFEPIADSTFTFTRNALQYSVDNGSTWIELAAGTASPTVSAGNKIMWKRTGLTPTPNTGIGTFSATGNFNAYGNIMSLYYGDNFENQVDLTGKDYAFSELFKDCTNLVSAENMILPATTLASDACYHKMFYNCSGLTSAPALPATTLQQSCYNSMFYSCTSLTQAPELPATTLAAACYASMFHGCTNLSYIKCLATNISASACLWDWVSSVAASGTFAKAASMGDWTTGTDGIPSGWTVEDAA